ncbi:unnamed protein product [Heterobilharzia americana]|nr:unnamed protein product [Heterobilharzia americana]
MQKNKRQNRGPLRAISNILPTATSCQTVKYPELVDNKEKTDSEIDYGNGTHLTMDNNVSTPVLRVSSGRLSLTKTSQSRYDVLPMPLRSSSYRSDKQNVNTSKSDIRRHFPIRTGASKLSFHEKSPTKAFETTFDSSLNTSVNGNTSLESLSPIANTTRKRHLSTCQVITEPKQPRYTDSYKSVRLGNDSDAIFMAMGAEVKTHPRYCLRKSAGDFVFPKNIQASPKNSRKNLSPICPVPMPSGFPLQLPIRYSSVSLPWERNVHSRASLSRTAETQTSPTDLSMVSQSGKPKERRHTGIGLRTSGTTQVLQNLRKKFGNLRRAISADRLNKNSSTPSEIRKACHDLKSPSQTPDKNDPLVVNMKSDTNVQTDASYKLTCEVIRKNSDGSVQILLRRSSTNGQFGFFIARDSKGIYVSRLGSVRCAAKLWDVFHVGDRILEVQGMPCANLDVEEVRNLIRGCELVEFKIKSCHHSDFKFSQKCPIKLSLS